MSSGITCPDHVPDISQAGSYSIAVPFASRAHLSGDDLTIFAAVAAVEAVTRLGRGAPVTLRTVEGELDVREWPSATRSLSGPEARSAIRAPAAANAGAPRPDDQLVVGLSVDGSRPPDAADVHLDAALDGETLSVTVRTAREDRWGAAPTVVAEVFAEVLGALLADPSAPPRAVAGLGARSRARVLGELAGRAVEDGPFAAIPAMVERQADLHPHRPAVSHLGRTLTYRQFDEAANGLAAALADAGVGRGDVVPVLASGAEMPVAYFALMKLGAAFVPVDPAWPTDRIHTTLEVLRPPVALCAAGVVLPDRHRHLTTPLALDRIRPCPARPAVALGPDDLIYGIFTSGTTGVPKCALNTHGGLANRFRFMTRYFAGRGDEVVLQNSRPTFDSSVWQLFWPLTTGGRTVIPPQRDLLNLDHTIETIHTHGVTMTDFVPSVFNALVSLVDLDRNALARISSLRQLVVGGEEINPRMAHRLGALLPDVRITNGYGPTEASIGMVFHPVSPGDGAAVPLGRPIDNCYAVVVDQDLHPLPPGATGEIVIGGACLGVGYLADPDRTAAVFVPNPFAEIPGDRLYRTGDLGRFSDDGRLWFLGRKDFQVKIGGVRIELTEIDAVAQSWPGVRQAKTVVVGEGTTRSLAVFATGDERVTEAALQHHLRGRLPRHSVPRHYVVLPRLPLTEAGKVDRAALRTVLEHRLAADAARLAAGGAHPAGVAVRRAGPNGDAPLGERILRIFRAALGQPDLTAADDFLHAGGDSIQAVSVVAAVAEAGGVEVGVQDLYDQPTAAAMTTLVERRRRTAPPVETEAALMARDARVPADLTIVPADADHPLRTVLVTGATGFVGGRLVHELLVRTTLDVVCVCRAPDDATAVGRVRAALAEQRLWDPAFGTRLTAVAGDLGQPRLGLTDAGWDHLARTCDVVLHNGALVNFLFDYRAHRASNVVGTHELLRLAMAHRPKPLHYVSTLGVLDGEAARHPRPLPEDADLSTAAVPASGYSRSKWVAERVLADARRHGATVTVYRPGEVMPSAREAHPNGRALTHLLLSAFHRLGAAPAAPMWSDYTPVDYVAHRVVAGLLDRDAWGRTLNVFHPERVDFARVLSRTGEPIETVPCGEFLARLRRAARGTGDREFGTLLALVGDTVGADEPTLRRVFAGLLTDNPRLFGKDACRRCEQRWDLADEPLDAAVAAYRRVLAGHRPPPDLRSHAAALPQVETC